MGLKLHCPLYIVGFQREKQTLCTWWKPDKIFNPNQRPDLLVDLDKKWLVKSTRKTEYHQSSNARHNDPTVPHLCKLCPRRFKSST